MATDYRTKRIYDASTPEDGYRMLVDRLWPRGITKSAANLDLWAKDFAPSSELRRWFHEDTTRLNEFATKYLAELEDHRNEIGQLLNSIDNEIITLLTATKEPSAGHVPILQRFLMTID